MFFTDLPIQLLSAYIDLFWHFHLPVFIMCYAIYFLLFINNNNKLQSSFLSVTRPT
jgi:hypothetical protein